MYRSARARTPPTARARPAPLGLPFGPDHPPLKCTKYRTGAEYSVRPSNGLTSDECRLRFTREWLFLCQRWHALFWRYCHRIPLRYDHLLVPPFCLGRPCSHLASLIVCADCLYRRRSSLRSNRHSASRASQAVVRATGRCRCHYHRAVPRGCRRVALRMSRLRTLRHTPKLSIGDSSESAIKSGSLVAKKVLLPPSLPPSLPPPLP